jgi:sortase A
MWGFFIFSLRDYCWDMPDGKGLVAVRCTEVFSYMAGVILVGFFVIQLVQAEVQRQDGISRFEQVSGSADNNPPLHTFEAPGEPDTSLWAPGRIADYQASIQGEIPPILAVLEIPTVGLKVPVYPTDSDLNMDRGAGVVDGMAYPHEPGNIGIAGHRDGYFRVLKDVKAGDPVLLQTLEGPKKFRVDATQVVEITDKRLLQDTEAQTVTLVTCYPFYFVGHAPKRFIVTASLDTTYVNQQ